MQILEYHVIPNQVIYAANFTQGEVLTSVINETLTVRNSPLTARACILGTRDCGVPVILQTVQRASAWGARLEPAGGFSLRLSKSLNDRCCYFLPKHRSCLLGLWSGTLMFPVMNSPPQMYTMPSFTKLSPA